MSIEDIEEEIRKEYRAQRRHELWTGVKRAFVDRCKYDQEWRLNRFERFFYTFKCLACVLFRRDWKQKYGNYPDYVEVSTIYARTLYAGWEACWLTVGHGIFKNWFYMVETDGDWCM